MKRNRIVKKTRSQLERKASDPCNQCPMIEEDPYYACVNCKHKHRAFPALTPEQGGLDDPEELSRNNDTLMF